MDYLPTTRAELGQFVNDIYEKILYLETNEIVEVWNDLRFKRIHQHLKDIEPYTNIDDTEKINPVYFKIFNNLINKIVPEEFLIKRRFQCHIENGDLFTNILDYNYLFDEYEIK